MEIKGAVQLNLHLMQECSVCEGEGRVYVKMVSKHVSCINCSGKGKIITPNGFDLLDFLQDNFKPKTIKRRRK